MTARTYNLDPEAAKQANTGGKRITDSGAYVGTFRNAFYERNEKGTESLNLMFEADTGQEIGPLAIYTHNGKGEELPGYNAVNALMTCMEVRAMEAKAGPVELYDFDVGHVVTKNKDTYPALVGKPVGLLLRREEYENRSGEIKERIVVAGSFNPKSRLMANEILSRKTEPNDLDLTIAWLERDPVKKLKGRSGAAPARSASASANDFADDDIPF